jgi:hypothetical protein
VAASAGLSARLSPAFGRVRGVSIRRSWAVVALLAGCASHDPLAGYEELKPTTALEAPAPDPSWHAGTNEEVSHGLYLVELLGCGTCHTDGALTGEPRMDRRLAGSDVGIAYSDPVHDPHPGVVYPRNLTPDVATGLGGWSDDQIMRAIRTGLDRHGSAQLLVMPWGAYARMSESDLRSIVAYLRSLPPVSHRVPEDAAPGHKAPSPYVHFGTYRSKATMPDAGR